LFKRLILAVFLFASPLLITPTVQAVVDAPCSTYSWTGEDDTAHQMALPFSLPLGNTTYDTAYVTTNGTLTFGAPDANFSSYPNTPSISLAGYDWVTFGQGAQLSYGVNNTGLCILWDVRPYPQSTGELTHIKLTVDISTYPSWSGVVESTGWLPANLRRGVRFAPNTDVVTISEAFTVDGGLPVEMQPCWDGSVIPLASACPPEPTPTPTPESTPTSTPEPTLSPEPTPTPEPTPEPSEIVSPTPTPSSSESSFPIPEEPDPSPTELPALDLGSPLEEVIPEEFPILTPEPSALTMDPFVPPVDEPSIADVLVAAYEDTAIPADVFEASGLDYEDLPPDQLITLDNGVVLTAEIADALEIFESPSEILETIFIDPRKAFKAISNVGADLPADVRKTAQQGTVAVILVGQVIVGGVTASIARR